jgi:hypothetical protein
MEDVPTMGMFDLYMEMITQFGYLVLFGAAVPLAPALALVSNYIELRSIASKLLFTTKCGPTERARSIGPWLGVMRSMSLMAVVSNGLLFCFTSPIIPGLSSSAALLVLFIWEVRYYLRCFGSYHSLAFLRSFVDTPRH